MYNFLEELLQEYGLDDRVDGHVRDRGQLRGRHRERRRRRGKRLETGDQRGERLADRRREVEPGRGDERETRNARRCGRVHDRLGH